MKSPFYLALPLIAGLSHVPLAAQDDPVPELTGFAESFVAAYNEKDLDAIVALYTEEAEIIDESESSLVSGRREIRELFSSSFEEAPDRRIGLEVLSVRQIAENVVVEDGVAQFSDSGEGEADAEVSYSAILVRSADDGWLIATSRELFTDTPETDPLEPLALLEGDWIMQGDQMQMDLSLQFSPSGRSLHGSASVTTPAEGIMETEIRIGYDAARRQIRWWTFDEEGGFAQGTWQPLEGSWLVRTNGVTATGETNSVIQELAFEDDDTVSWKSTHRFLDGIALPDSDLRLVRVPPAPSISFESEVDADARTVAIESTRISPFTTL